MKRKYIEWKVARTDSPDHYIPLTMWSGTQVIDSAYHLPTIFSGEYSHYVNCGAYVPISVECQSPFNHSYSL